MTIITQENTSIMAESVNYTRLYKNVAKNTDLNWSEKAILSLIITAQVNGKEFILTDLQLHKLLYIDAGNINKYISLLAKRNIITKTTASIPSISGGKPKRRRTITVLNLESWTHDNKKPVFTAINVIKKKKAKAPVKKLVKKPKEALTDDLTPATKQSVDSAVNVSKIEANEPINEAEEVVVAVESDIVQINHINNEDSSVDDVTIDVVDIDYITIDYEDNLYNRSYIVEFLELYPNYQENKPLTVYIDFGDGDNLADEVYFYKEVDGVNKYISVSNIEDYNDRRGLYKN